MKVWKAFLFLTQLQILTVRDWFTRGEIKRKYLRRLRYLDLQKFTFWVTYSPKLQ